MNAILTPRCPGCDEEPAPGLGLLWPHQAWCSNEECRVLVWDATLTLTQNVARMQHVTWEE